MKNILFLDCVSDDFYRIQRSKVDNVDSLLLYKNKKIFNKIIRFFGIHFFTPLLFFSYGDWKYNIKKYDIIIVSSRKSAKYAIKYIKNNSNCRVIVWYWNIVTKNEINPYYCKKQDVEVWTFDKCDADKYGMKFNDTYYFDCQLKDNKKEKKYDVFYVGLEKSDRIELINKLLCLFDSNSITYNINIVKLKKICLKNHNIKYSNYMPYNEVLNNISNCKAILDINISMQSGLSLRPMEALFFKKKLITNNIDIMKCEFYSPQNIFILGYDNIDKLSNFINGSYEDIDSKIINKYIFSNWLKRIIDDKEL